MKAFVEGLNINQTLGYNNGQYSILNCLYVHKEYFYDFYFVNAMKYHITLIVGVNNWYCHLPALLIVKLYTLIGYPDPNSSPKRTIHGWLMADNFSMSGQCQCHRIGPARWPHETSIEHSKVAQSSNEQLIRLNSKNKLLLWKRANKIPIQKENFSLTI